MKHMLARLISSLSLVIFGIAIVPRLSQPPTSPSLQATPVTAWVEGLPASSGTQQSNLPVSSVPTTAGTTYLTFSGTRFRPTASTLTYQASGGAIYATALPAGGFSLSLDFDLPSGATLTEVVFFVIDNDATNMSLELDSYNPETGSFPTLESGASSGASSSLQTIVIPVDPPVQVDNTTTSYRLRVVPGVASINHLLRGARIGYIASRTYLPNIQK